MSETIDLKKHSEFAEILKKEIPLVKNGNLLYNT